MSPENPKYFYYRFYNSKDIKIVIKSETSNNYFLICKIVKEMDYLKATNIS